MTVKVILLLVSMSTAMGSQQGYDYCISSAGHGLLSSGGRCVKVEGRDLSWDGAMDKCNGLGGYLFHVYSSQDLEALKQWALTTTSMANYGCWTGLKKIGLLDGNFTGYNMKWMMSKTAGIQTTVDNQCGSCIWWEYPGSKSDSYMYGQGWFHYNVPAQDLGKMFMYGPTHGGYPFTICEFSAETNPNQVQFVGHEKQISPGSVFEKSSVKNAVHCAFKCSPLFYCQGFNVIGNVPNLDCQIITQTIEDTYLGTLVDKSDGVYFERKKT